MDLESEQRIADLERRNRALQEQVLELETVCRVWVAASNVKDCRIEELEAELRHMRARLARLTRWAADRGDTASSPSVRFSRGSERSERW